MTLLIDDRRALTMMSYCVLIIVILYYSDLSLTLPTKTTSKASTKPCGCVEPGSLDGPWLAWHSEVASTLWSEASEKCASSCLTATTLSHFYVAVQSLKEEEEELTAQQLFFPEEVRMDEEPWRWDCRCLQHNVNLQECSTHLVLPVTCRSREHGVLEELEKESYLSKHEEEEEKKEKRATFILLAIILGFFSILALASLALKTWCQHRRDDRGESNLQPTVATVSGTEKSLKTSSSSSSSSSSSKNPKQRGRLVSVSHFAVYEKK